MYPDASSGSVIDLPTCDTINGNVQNTANENITFNAKCITEDLTINVASSSVTVTFPYLTTIGGSFTPKSSFSSGIIDIPYLTCIGGGIGGTQITFPKLNLGMSGPGVTIGKDINFRQSTTSFANSKIISINGSMYYEQGTDTFDWSHLKTLAGDVYITQTATSGQGQLNFQSIETIGTIYLTQPYDMKSINLQSVQKFYATYAAIYCGGASIPVLSPDNQTALCDLECTRVNCDNGTVPILTDKCSFQDNTGDATENGINIALIAGCAAAGAALIGAGGAFLYWRSKSKTGDLDQKLIP